MDAEGCIPISLIATFNRVKALTQDIQLILEAVNVSDIVELVDGVKVIEPKTYYKC
jgi:la-related protein 1